MSITGSLLAMLLDNHGVYGPGTPSLASKFSTSPTLALTFVQKYNEYCVTTIVENNTYYFKTKNITTSGL